MVVYYAKSGWYRLSLPEGFIVDDEQIPISIYEPRNGVGAVQLSVFEVEYGEVNLKDELENFVTTVLRIPSEALPSFGIETLGNQRVANISQVKYNDRCYFVRLIHRGERIALITYNALCDDFAKEIAHVRAMSDSFELLGQAT